MFRVGSFFPTGRILSNDFHGELHPPLARCPDVALFPFFLTSLVRHPIFCESRIISTRFPPSLSQSRDKLIDPTRQIIVDRSPSLCFPRVSTSLSPFLSSPSTSSSFHPRNQKRSPPEQFYPFVGKRPGPARKSGDNPLSPLPVLPPTIPRRPRELLPLRSSRLNDGGSRPFRHSRRGLPAERQPSTARQ